MEQRQPSRNILSGLRMWVGMRKMSLFLASNVSLSLEEVLFDQISFFSRVALVSDVQR